MVAVSTVHSRARGMGATASLSSLSDCLAVLLPCLAEPLSIGDARDAEWIHLATTFASVVLTSVLPQRYWPLVAVLKHPANAAKATDGVKILPTFSTCKWWGGGWKVEWLHAHRLDENLQFDKIFYKVT